MLLFKKAQEIKLVSDTNERKTLEADEQKIIETAIQNELFEHLKISHKLEEYAPLIVWNRSNPPTSFIYEKRRVYTPMLLVIHDLFLLTKVLLSK